MAPTENRGEWGPMLNGFMRVKAGSHALTTNLAYAE
jgi:hypothetical protein